MAPAGAGHWAHGVPAPPDGSWEPWGRCALAGACRFDAGYREDVKLRDGTRVRLRVVQPADRELLRRGFDRLSPRSRYLRFLSPKNGLSDTEVDDLMALDGRDRFALGAQRLQPSGGEGEGLGIARFARLPDRPAVAEAAVTVTDEAQGKGLGTILLVRLAAAARERGVERFTCEFDAGNEQIWHLINHLEPRVEVLDHGFVRAEVPVPPLGAQPGPRKARPPARAPSAPRTRRRTRPRVLAGRKKG
jgi:GNAT superfamily N-acetyltransferase